MKKPKRKKPEPKFNIGQVVVVRDVDGFLFRVESRCWSNNSVWEYLTPHSRQYDEAELRPLNKRERGQ